MRLSECQMKWTNVRPQLRSKSSIDQKWKLISEPAWQTGCCSSCSRTPKWECNQISTPRMAASINNSVKWRKYNSAECEVNESCAFPQKFWMLSQWLVRRVLCVAHQSQMSCQMYCSPQTRHRSSLVMTLSFPYFSYQIWFSTAASDIGKKKKTFTQLWIHFVHRYSYRFYSYIDSVAQNRKSYLCKKYEKVPRKVTTNEGKWQFCISSENTNIISHKNDNDERVANQ